ncbi:hypothetical protein CU098_005126 [Rhizopus stolonifer]|uniref:Cytochrome P450-dit2 n=1 Tax=Rhizopus stolonifer TaxID=4846 RepID=A0A367JIN0_RHIST|nr:hypothetical protein CU098_005126 [Rhizopus stolonifer]
MEKAYHLVQDRLSSLSESRKIAITSITAATAAVVLYRLFSREKKDPLLKEIPMARNCYPVVGHMLSLGKHPGRTVDQWHKELGPIFQIRMGIQTWVMINDPVLAHTVFSKHGMQVSDRAYNKYCITHYAKGGKGVAFVQPRKNWKEARTAVLSVLSPKQIETVYLHLVEEESKRLIDKLLLDTSSHVSEGIVVNKYLHLASMNIVLQLGFGMRYQAVEDPEFRHLSDTILKSIELGTLVNDMSGFIPAFKILEHLSGQEKHMKHHIEQVRDPLLRRLMNDALCREGPNVTKSLEGYDLSSDDKLVIISDFLAGGTDTVSVTLSWTVALLCHHPEIQQRVADEIQQFVRKHNRFPQFSDRDQVPYVNCVLKESLRFRPVTAFGIPHAVKEDVVIDQYLFKKGTSVMTPMESIHWNPQVYFEPERFFPERFINDTKTMNAAANGRPEERDHFNFGWGRRLCPGIYLAEVELFIVFVQLIGRCIVEPPTDEKGQVILPDIDHPNSSLTLSPRTFKVKFIKRP